MFLKIVFKIDLFVGICLSTPAIRVQPGNACRKKTTKPLKHRGMEETEEERQAIGNQNQPQKRGEERA
jgi:hypothetical protein